MKRVFLIVLDSVGIGAQADAHLFGDAGANTMKRISRSDKFNCPNLIKMGLGNIDGVDYLEKAENPTAAVMKMTEKSMGKDTTIGHWEIAGIVSEKAMPTYPDGFPKELIDEFSKRCGRGVICNGVGSGTEIIKEWGKEHVETGNLIVYTSADSVFQIAAHEEVVPLDELYKCCEIARELLCGEHAVGRVIARPFIKEAPNFERTANRRDFSLKPTADTLLDYVKKSGKDVIAVGKISDIFAGVGVTEKIVSHSNSEGMEITRALLDREFEGLCFTNLVDFDMKFGHRQDIDGYAAALSEFDRWLPSFVEKMGEDDVLMITADHGCDPGDESTDHTREHTPFIVYGKKIKAGEYGVRESFADIGKTVADMLGVKYNGAGESLAQILTK